MAAHWKQSRKITTRIVAEGVLRLEEPAHFGGEADETVDLPLLVAADDGVTPLLPGASLTGALRSYLRARDFGYFKPPPSKDNPLAIRKEQNGDAAMLFGGFRADDKGLQSAVVVEDSYGLPPETPGGAVELRDGVTLDPATRTAAAGKLFNLECWPAGTRFPLRLELAVHGKEDESKKRLRAFCQVLQALQDGEIALGARKIRGYGKAKVDQWYLRRYNLTRPDGLIAWLRHGHEDLLSENVQALSEIVLDKYDAQATTDVWTTLGVVQPEEDKRRWLHLDACFTLDGSLLIRSSLAPDRRSPDTVHLHAHRADGNIQPVLSGTSLAGALRARARKIARTLCPDDSRVAQLVGALFGYGPDDGPPQNNGPVQRSDQKRRTQSSRLHTREHALSSVETGLVQNRVSIDRFTGGAFPTALFNEQPAFGGNDSTVRIELRLLDPRPHEIGLILLVLKDLWTGDLPLGGEQSVGRGRLRGRKATFTLYEALRPDGNGTISGCFELAAQGDAVDLKNLENDDVSRAVLERYVTALNAQLNPKANVETNA